MDHLKILSWLSWFSAATLVLAALITGGSLGLTVWALLAVDPNATAAVWPIAGITGLTLALIGVMAVLAVLAGRGLPQGKARVPATVLAVFSLSSIPFGTAYGAYLLWACWVNPETRDRFEGSARGLIPWVAAGLAALLLPLVPLIVLSVAALLPTDLAALDAEWEPIEDRSHRVEGPGCGLTEVAPDCTPARPSSVRTEEVSFPTRSAAMGFTRLNGTLHLPEGLPGPRPAVVLLHGSGPADRDEKAPGEVVAAYEGELKVFEALAEHLAAEGLVVLRYDKRACGRCYPEEHADADYTQFRFELFLEDAQAAADFLASRPEVDGARLVVIGHSQGGGFAPHLAARDDRFVAAVMLAGFTGTFAAALPEQLERIGGIRARQWDWLGAWSADLQAQVVRSCLGKLEGDYDPDDMCLGGGVTLQAIAEYDALNATTPAVIGALDVPLCAIAGTVDRNVPPQELLAIREARGDRDGEVHLIAGMGHGLRDLLDPSDPPEIEPELYARLDRFLATVRTPLDSDLPGGE